MSWSIPGEQTDAVRFTTSPRRYGGTDYRKAGEVAMWIILQEGEDWLTAVAVPDDPDFVSYKDVEGWTTFADVNLFLVTMGGTEATILSNALWDDLDTHLTDDLSTTATLVLDVSPAFRWSSATGSWRDVSGVPVCPPSGEDDGGDSRTYPNPGVSLWSAPLIEYDSDTNMVRIRHASTDALYLGPTGAGADVTTYLGTVDSHLDTIDSRLDAIEGRLDALEGG